MVEPIRIPLPGGDSRPAVLQVPDGDGPFPGVVIIHDIFGLRPDTERHCHRFADEGYAAIAPDLYDGNRAGCVVQTLLAARRHRGPAYDAIAAAREALVERANVDPDRIGITGFCLGGGFALIAAADDAYAVAAPFYGESPKRAERLRGICPTLAQYGAKDAPFRSHAERLRRHLEELGVEHEVLIHEGAGHSFMNDHGEALPFRLGRHLSMRAQYDAPTEEIAWRKLLAWFDQHMPPSDAAA